MISNYPITFPITRNRKPNSNHEILYLIQLFQTLSLYAGGGGVYLILSCFNNLLYRVFTISIYLPSGCSISLFEMTEPTNYIQWFVVMVLLIEMWLKIQDYVLHSSAAVSDCTGAQVENETAHARYKHTHTRASHMLTSSAPHPCDYMDYERRVKQAARRSKSHRDYFS